MTVRTTPIVLASQLPSHYVRPSLKLTCKSLCCRELLTLGQLSPCDRHSDNRLVDAHILRIRKRTRQTSFDAKLCNGCIGLRDTRLCGFLLQAFDFTKQKTRWAVVGRPLLADFVNNDGKSARATVEE